jgi:mitotic spindle assembly checkpoint protein MAD2
MGADATVITLKGSVEIVSEFFFTAINSILYQRGKLNVGDQIRLRFNPISITNIRSHFLHHSRPTIGIYQPETFKRESKYGLTVLTTTDSGLLSYLGSVMSQMASWLTDGDVQRLVLVVAGIDSGETLERWQFNVLVDDDSNVKVSKIAGNDENLSQNVVLKSNASGGGDRSEKAKGSKTVKEVHDEIQAIIRQITASVSME